MATSTAAVQLKEVFLTHEDLDLKPLDWKPSDLEREFLQWATGGADEDEIRRRVLDVRARSYKIWPYPCIQLGVYVKLMMRNTSDYRTILEQARSAPPSETPKLLEIGCFMGTQLRKLLMDGYPSDPSDPSLIGTDLRKEFLDLGYELFQDGPSSERPVPIALHPADIFDDASILTSYKGKLRYIFVGSVFHLFELDAQTDMARRVLDLLDIPAEVPTGSGEGREYIIFGTQEGRQVASAIQDQYTAKSDGKVKNFGHSPDTWREMFEGVIKIKYGAEWMADHVRLEARLAKPIQVGEFLYTELAWSIHITI